MTPAQEVTGAVINLSYLDKTKQGQFALSLLLN